MIRDIEARSGAVIDIDQTTKDMGHVTVNFRGSIDQKKKAYGLVVAEVVKVSDQSPGTYDCSSFGAKEEIQLDGKYVGWVKGPRGKVVTDISTRSGTRVDMDQSNPAFAVVKIYGTYEGIQTAKELMAFELAKVDPAAAQAITGQVYAQQQAHQQQSTQVVNPAFSAVGSAQPDLSNLSSLLAQVAGGSGQAGQLQNYLQQMGAM